MIHTMKNKNVSNVAYVDKYLVYTRKSTDEEHNQKNSIDYQIEENLKFSHQHNLSIAQITIEGFCANGIIIEKHSGFKESNELSFNKKGEVQYRIERPKFQQLLQVLNQQKIKGVVCLCWDRISRNKADDALLDKLMRRGVDIQFVYANYDNTSAGQLHKDIDGMFAHHHSRVTSEKVKLAILSARRKGKCTYRAPLGYLNSGTMDEKPIDPIKAPIVKRLFELYATGEHSTATLEDYARSQGLVHPPRRRKRTSDELLDPNFDIKNIKKVQRPVHKKDIYRILKNPFYIGMVKGEHGEYIKSISHEPLINVHLFQKVQKELGRKCKTKKYKKKLNLPLRGKIRCGGCNRLYTPYIKKGICYFLVKCSSNCTNNTPNINLDFILQSISSSLASFVIDRQDSEQIKEHLMCYEDEKLVKSKKIKQDLNNQINNVKESIAYLEDNKLALIKNEVYTPKQFLSQNLKLQSELLQLSEKNESIISNQRDSYADILKVLELINNVVLLYDFANTDEKVKIIEKLFLELYVSRQSLSYVSLTGIETLKSNIGTLGAPNVPKPELICKKDYMELYDTLIELTAT